MYNSNTHSKHLTVMHCNTIKISCHFVVHVLVKMYGFCYFIYTCFWKYFMLKKHDQENSEMLITVH